MTHLLRHRHALLSILDAQTLVIHRNCNTFAAGWTGQEVHLSLCVSTVKTYAEVKI